MPRRPIGLGRIMAAMDSITDRTQQADRTLDGSTATASRAPLTFLFTDVEGSTRLWEEHPQAMESALARHDVIIRSAVATSDGEVVKSTGDGLMAELNPRPYGRRLASRLLCAHHSGLAAPPLFCCEI